MRLDLVCMMCLDVDLPAGNQLERIDVEPRNDGVYQIRCARGHETQVTTNHKAFEILYEIGITAVADGYYREAISSFFAALERYYEFALKFIWKVSKVEDPEAEKVWKAISKQSERQLGAYVGAFLGLIGKAPPLIDQKMTELRNKVVHQGHIPNQEEALQCAYAVRACIYDNWRLMLMDNKLEVMTEVRRLIFPSLEKEEDEANMRFVFNKETVLSISRPRFKDMTLEQVVVELRSLASTSRKSP